MKRAVSDGATTSVATMHALMHYVKKRKPFVVILENVIAMDASILNEFLRFL